MGGKLLLLDFFVSYCLECYHIVDAVFDHYLKLEVIVVVEVLYPMIYFGMVRVVEEFCMSVDLFGFHHHIFFCGSCLGLMDLILVYVV